ncbi:MAG: hypothetical protein AAB438_00295 [Patescibacteria group bacterium]
MQKFENVSQGDKLTLKRQSAWGSTFEWKLKKDRAKGKLLPFAKFSLLSDGDKFIETYLKGGFYVELPDHLKITFSPMLTVGKMTPPNFMTLGTMTGLDWTNDFKTCFVSGEVGYVGGWRWTINVQRYLAPKLMTGVFFDENRCETNFNFFFGKRNETQLGVGVGAQGFWGYTQMFPKSGTVGVSLLQKI